MVPVTGGAGPDLESRGGVRVLFECRVKDTRIDEPTHHLWQGMGEAAAEWLACECGVKSRQSLPIFQVVAS